MAVRVLLATISLRIEPIELLLAQPSVHDRCHLVFFQPLKARISDQYHFGHMAALHLLDHTKMLRMTLHVRLQQLHSGFRHGRLRWLEKVVQIAPSIVLGQDVTDPESRVHRVPLRAIVKNQGDWAIGRGILHDRFKPLIADP